MAPGISFAPPMGRRPSPNGELQAISLYLGTMMGMERQTLLSGGHQMAPGISFAPPMGRRPSPNGEPQAISLSLGTLMVMERQILPSGDQKMAYGLSKTAPMGVIPSMKITLDSGTSFDLEFADRNKVVWQSGNERSTDWCEVVEVAPRTYLIDMTFTYQPRQSQTFIVNSKTRQALAVRTITREGDVGKEPRAFHNFSPGVLRNPGISPTGRKLAATRDLIGLPGALYLQPWAMLRTYLPQFAALCPAMHHRAAAW